MSIKPMLDRVVLKSVEKTNKTTSWIYIPVWQNTEKTFIYEVVEVWPWKPWIDMIVKPWDMVLCWQYSWDEITYEWIDYKIVANEYILATVN